MPPQTIFGYVPTNTTSLFSVSQALALSIFVHVRIRGKARGQGRQAPPSNYVKVGVRDKLAGSIEIASATALFYLERGVSLYSKGNFSYI